MNCCLAPNAIDVDDGETCRDAIDGGFEFVLVCDFVDPPQPRFRHARNKSPTRVVSFIISPGVKDAQSHSVQLSGLIRNSSVFAESRLTKVQSSALS